MPPRSTSTPFDVRFFGHKPICARFPRFFLSSHLCKHNTLLTYTPYHCLLLVSPHFFYASIFSHRLDVPDTQPQAQARGASRHARGQAASPTRELTLSSIHRRISL